MSDVNVKEAQHTPGLEYIPPENLSHDAIGVEHQLTPGGILETYEDGDCDWVIEGEIDPKLGRLFAAAPELLAALKCAIGALEFSRDYHSDLGNEDQAYAQDMLDAAIAAIAKAEAR